MMERKAGPTMEQLWYTWSPVGLGGVAGFRVRAASDGVADMDSDLFRTFRPFLGYTLPQGTDPYRATTETSPFCLAFVDTGKEHILVHKVFTGKDAYGRAGIYFIHLLASLPETFVASTAIELWGSRFWETSDAKLAANSLTLPPVSLNELLRGSLSERDMRQVQEYLPFVIEAFLSLKKEQKLYIAADPAVVAALIWGLTRSLPWTLQQEQNITFSTYEQDVFKAAARIVGTCRAATATQDSYARASDLLPSDCFTGRGLALGLDCYTGKRAEFARSPEVVEYAQYATQCLVGGQKRMLDELLADAVRNEVKDTGALLVTYQFTMNAERGSLSEEQINGLLGNRKIATWLLAKKGVQRSIVHLAILNSAWWQQHGQQAISQLRDPFDRSTEPGLSALGQGAADYAYEAITTNNEAAIKYTLSIMETATPPDKDFGPWLSLFTLFSQQDPRKPPVQPAQVLSWTWRSWLLQQWAIGAHQIHLQLIVPWLPTTWEELKNFLDLKRQFPAQWQELAIRQVLVSNPQQLSDEAFKLVANEPTLFEEALKLLMQESQTQSIALNVFANLAGRKYRNKLPLLASLLGVESSMPIDVDAFLRVARLSDKEKIVLLDNYAQDVLLSCRGRRASPLVLDLIDQYLDTLRIEKLEESVTVHALAALQHVTLPTPLASKARTWYLVGEGTLPKEGGSRKILIESKHLQELGKAILSFHLQKNERYMEGFHYLLVINAYSSIATSEKLASVVESLGPIFTHKRTAIESYCAFLQELATFLGGRYQDDKNMTYLWAMPYIALSIEYAQHLPGSSHGKFLDGLLSVLLKSISREEFDNIERAVQSWPDMYVGEWQTYGSKWRPKGFTAKAEAIGSNIMEMGGNLGKKILPSSKPTHMQAPTQLSPAQPNQVFEQQTYTNQGQPAAPNVNMGRQPSRPLEQYVERRPSQPLILNPHPSPNQPPAQGTDRWQGQPTRPTSGAQQPPPQQYNMLPSAQNQFSPNMAGERNAQVSRPDPSKAVSTVNGTLILRSMLDVFHTLKGFYIPLRLKELQKNMKDAPKRSGGDSAWILDEIDLLQNYSNREGTRWILENDVLIADAIQQFQQASRDTLLNVNEKLPAVKKDVKKQGDCVKVMTSHRYDDGDLDSVLLVFLRYRTLAQYLRRQDTQTKLREWVEERRTRAQIQRPVPMLGDE